VIRRRRLGRVRSWAGGWCVSLIALVAAGCGGSGGNSAAGRSIRPGLVLERSGLLGSYPFNASKPTSALAGQFRLGGSAGPADSSVRALADGLNVSVGSRKLGNWAGYFAATASTYPASAVFHVRMWRPSPPMPVTSQSGISLFAIQTGQYSNLNYVVVAGVVTRGSAYWLVGHATGNATYAQTKVLWIRQSAAAHEDVTLRTNGHSSYAVYFGNKLVYKSTALDLKVTPPFRAYLEVQARGIPYQTRFQDFWVARSDAVQVVGLHPGTHVTLTPNGGASVQAVASAAGQVQLVLPLTKAVGRGTLVVDSSARKRQFEGIPFAGGDVYRVSR
jgi:hypothetical protein